MYSGGSGLSIDIHFVDIELSYDVLSPLPTLLSKHFNHPHPYIEIATAISDTYIRVTIPTVHVHPAYPSIALKLLTQEHPTDTLHSFSSLSLSLSLTLSLYLPWFGKLISTLIQKLLSLKLEATSHHV